MASGKQSLVDLTGLDTLRGLLAVFVVAHHARWLCWTGQAQWRMTEHTWLPSAIANVTAVFRYGHEAVMVFFALSGFFIHLRAAKQFAVERQCERLNVRRFTKRRLHRLAAPYFLVLFLTFVLDSIGRHSFPSLYVGDTGNALLDQNFSGGNYSARAVIPGLVMLPRSLGLTFGSNGPLWSLGYEVVYYAFYPLWLMVRRHSLWFAYLGIPFICFVIAGLSLGAWLPAVISHWPIWIAGAGLAEWLMLRNHQISRRGGGTQALPKRDVAHWRNRFCLYGLALTVVGFAGCQISQLPMAILLSYAVLGCGCVLSFCTLPTVIGGMKFFSAWQFLGFRSYTIYILHFPLLALMAAPYFQAGGPPSDGWFALAAAIATTLICVAVFELCERWFVHARIRVESRPEPT
ncbi:acyltransferase family protein [Allorhodopirellula solitaria]|uniref:Acyltransferase family protein n=1 Tax=Allorhodopirellula solitaria TaxID=2527987 RepID=A0A5C5YB63_9BACT|nr:acyltransferase [Allorhodopirellula solitaria]TWT72937.1 Acyltransferase family protein [Allorhodopirellula solitaria]